LEVLASTSIKRKKPWPCFAWLGEVSFASIHDSSPSIMP
jgi:hypothetical protein